MDGAILQGVLINETIEVSFQCTGHFGRSPGAGTIAQALGALVGKAIDPLAEGGIGQRERIGDGLQALPFDDFTDCLSATEDSGLFRLFNTVSNVGRASSGKWSWRVRIGRPFHIKYYKKTQIWHLTSCDYPLIGTKPFRLKFPRSCSKRDAVGVWSIKRFSNSRVVGSVQCKSSRIKRTGCCSASSRRIATRVSSVF